MNFGEFIINLRLRGLELFERYYGPYKAKVVENDDPEGRGRIRVECVRARLGGNNNIWLFPMGASGPAHGEFWPPEKGAMVWIFFENGDPRQPLCYLGGLYGPQAGVAQAQKPNGAPVKRGWTTPGGNSITLDDTSGEEMITVKQKNGKIVKISKDKVSLGTEDGTFEPMMKGSTVKQWLETHTHSHPWSHTGTPVQPFPAAGLSSDTETT